MEENEKLSPAGETKAMKVLEERLFADRDEVYQKFHAALVPNLEPDKIIGVRTPQIRRIVKEIRRGKLSGCREADALSSLPHKYYEENQVHAFLINEIRDIKECVRQLDEFLPYVDNWATCDAIKPKVFKRKHSLVLEDIKRWISSEHSYTIRFGIGMLMAFFLDEDFSPQYLDMVSTVRHEDYYVKMMQAWYFATALAKQYDTAVIYLQEKWLPVWVHNKTIQKAVESRRISDETKAYLKTLRQ